MTGVGFGDGDYAYYRCAKVVAVGETVILTTRPVYPY